MLSGISIWQLLILLVIVLLIFGSKRLRHLGPDLGSALKGFRSAVKDDEEDAETGKDPKVVDHARRNAATDQDGKHSQNTSTDSSDTAGRRD